MVKMKKIFIIPLIFSFLSVPAYSQQVTTIQECREYQERYFPGGVDYYGNYFQGSVVTQRNNINCETGRVYSSTPYYGNNNSPQPYYNNNNYNNNYYNRGYYGRSTNPNCNPTRTALGALLGGAIGRSMTSTPNNRNNRGWATALGASIGGLAFAC
jgi:hypothetical protein